MNFIYKNYLNKLNVASFEQKDAINILNNFELQSIQKEYLKTIIQAALLAFFGVLCYYLPLYYIPIFSKTTQLTLFGNTITVAVYDTVLCLILTVIEIYFLTLIHLRMTHNIAVISGFVTNSNKENQVTRIANIATAKKNKEIIKYGLDPYQEVNKIILIFINLLNKLKGFLANKFLKYLIKRFAGRYAVKSVLDFAGAPIYMILNVYTTHLIYKNAKAEIFGNQLITKFVASLKIVDLCDFDKKLIYDTLQLIAISKRDFHPNHSILTERIMSFYKIPIEDKHIFNDSYYIDFEKAAVETKKVCQDILILGLILDGYLSITEKLRIKKLQQNKIFSIDAYSIAAAAKQFITGKEIILLPLT
jgi:hypothetical protein